MLLGIQTTQAYDSCHTVPWKRAVSELLLCYFIVKESQDLDHMHWILLYRSSTYRYILSISLDRKTFYCTRLLVAEITFKRPFLTLHFWGNFYIEIWRLHLHKLFWNGCFRLEKLVWILNQIVDRIETLDSLAILLPIPSCQIFKKSILQVLLILIWTSGTMQRTIDFRQKLKKRCACAIETNSNFSTFWLEKKTVVEGGWSLPWGQVVTAAGKRPW